MRGKYVRKIRLMLLSTAVAIAALLLPATASAAEPAPADNYPTEVGVAAVELDDAVAGTPPSGLPCISTTGAKACFEANGDRWWVQDTAADSASAEARWDNYRNGSLYRSGICRNSLGSGKWGKCNKNYYEDSSLAWIACVYDASEGVLIRCS
jgi:hypothetical protein